MTPADPLEKRLRLLEAHLEVQERVLLDLRAERAEGVRLNENIGRLGEGAAALGAALVLVNKTQQELAQKVVVVEQRADRAEEKAGKSASREDVSESVSESERSTQVLRRRLALRLLAVIGLMSLLMAGTLAFTINSDYHSCVNRQLRVDIEVAGFREIADIAKGSPAVPRILTLAQELEDTKLDCGALYPIHYGDGVPR